ncbi:SRPBCC domain-containing protein [Rhizobium sp. PL01]|uniref:SRPBCC domain-containing protein n=1 Tax=Rhizobium sp. PL01 TaxID=3085631 RepID=UPI002980AB06|nr:SRPBCC domain-containing protein [Rhizobium sp. PL01]MDW5314958.1 SRPBCC domain-containing protein [Rhizobium sp. PL01]
MKMPNIDHATIVLERSLAAAPSEVFAAWSDREALLDWSAPGNGWDMVYRAFDFRVGHTDVLTFGPIGAEPYINSVHYHAIRADQFIVYSSTVSHENGLLFTGTVLLELVETVSGTDFRLTETGFYFDGDSPEGHKEGWAAMLDGLAAYLARDLRAA